MPGLEDHLDAALEHLLAARLQLGVDKRLATPAATLDAALAADDAYRSAKVALLDAVAQGDPLEVESALHALVAQVTDRIWIVASTSLMTGRTP